MLHNTTISRTVPPLCTPPPSHPFFFHLISYISLCYSFHSHSRFESQHILITFFPFATIRFLRFFFRRVAVFFLHRSPFNIVDFCFSLPCLYHTIFLPALFSFSYINLLSFLAQIVFRHFLFCFWSCSCNMCCWFFFV